jgi:hypothetical protein
MEMVEVACDTCGARFEKQPAFVKEHNFCCRSCFAVWNSKRMSEYNRTTLNVKGKGAGHKSPHLSEWNRKRNSLFQVETDPSKRGERGHKATRRAAEAMLGRPLLKSEDVHHIDGNPANNAPENLRVMDKREHLRFHAAIARARMKGESND